MCFKSSHTQYFKAKIHFAHLNLDTKAGAAGDGAGEEKADFSLQKAALGTNNLSREGRAISVSSSDTKKNVIAKGSQMQSKGTARGSLLPRFDHL